eukprot:scaffold115712_cov63-Phaeocystis_antarctica.AAC.2
MSSGDGARQTTHIYQELQYTMPPARGSLLIFIPQPRAPRAFRKAGIGGVALQPLDHERLEAAGALPPHPSRNVPLHRRE